MVRFLHTGDWQLGMTRHYFSEGAQERFAQARFDAIRKLGEIAKDKECSFIVVCGDVFEHNLVKRQTVVKAVDALKDSPVPVFLLPGNHDPLDAASVYVSPAFLEAKPDTLHVLEDSTPIEVAPGVEIVGVPWKAKAYPFDLTAEAMSALEVALDKTRIMVAHGVVDALSPDRDDPDMISLEAAEAAIEAGKIDYLALGDRHSATDVGDSGRIRYSGAPEPTNFREIDSGAALVVEIDDKKVAVEKVAVGTWRFIERDRLEINSKADIDTLAEWLDDQQNKEKTVLKLRFYGAVSLIQYEHLMEIIEHARELFAAIETREKEFVAVPEDTDFAELGLSGFAGATLEDLRRLSEESSAEETTARDALSLLIRLTGRES